MILRKSAASALSFCFSLAAFILVGLGLLQGGTTARQITTGWALSTNQSVMRGYGCTSDGTAFLQTVIKNSGVMIHNGRSITPEEFLLYQLVWALAVFGAGGLGLWFLSS